MVWLLFSVLGLIVFFSGTLLIIYVGGAIASAAPLLVLLPLHGPIAWLIENLLERQVPSHVLRR